MKNLTITLDENVADWVRIWAARHKTSVSRLVGQMLSRRMLEDRGYNAAKNQFLSSTPGALKKADSYPDRSSLHER